jgi:hypothetical protein
VITSKLSRIPLSLVDTYESILRNILPTRKEDAWRILRWLLFGSRNLTLAELEVGLCLELGISNWNGFADDVEFLCGSLIRFDGPRREINFVHQTARTFLETFIQSSRPEDIAGLNLSVQAANEHLATTCLQYLLNERLYEELDELLRPVASYSTYVDTMENFLHRYPFMRYAVESWAIHIRATGTPSIIITTKMRELLSSLPNRRGIMTLLYFTSKNADWNVPEPTTPLHVAAYFNLHWLVDSYIWQDRISVNAVSDTNDTPLVWASEMGSTECVKKLLKAGADPNKFEYDGWSALHWAATNWRLSVMRLLLTHGARIDQRDDQGRTPLDWAIAREFWDGANLLQEWADKCKRG